MFNICRNKKGFTLVELMVVAVIVAILAAVLIPIMAGNRNRAFATEAVAALGTTRNSLRVYYAEHSAFPTLASGAVEGRVQGINTGDLTGTFFSGPNYTIVSDGVAGTYTITCTWNAAGNTAPRAADISSIATTTWLDQTGNFGGTR